MAGRFALALLALAAIGCECGAEGGGRGGTSTEPGPTGDTGIIEGVVRLAPDTTLPRYPESPTQVEGRPALPSSCSPPREIDRTPVTLAEANGALVGLPIVATGRDEARWPRATEPRVHEVTITDCRLNPVTIVATRGDLLRLSNRSEYPFFPDLGDGMLQYRTEDREITLDRGGARTIQCGWAAPCGRLELITLYHPMHTVTGAEGTFRLEGVPADQEVRLTAWHPLFEEAATTVTVGAGETARVELTIRPAPVQAAPPPPPPERDGPVEDHPDPNVPF